MKITLLNVRSHRSIQRTISLTGKMVMGTLLLGTALGAQAQPGEQNQGGRPGGRGNFQNMTPAQRQAMQEQMEERRAAQRQAWLRQAMTASGVADQAAQISIITYITAQEQSKTALQELARALSDSLTNPETSDEAIKTQLAAYRAAVAAADSQSATDLAALDAQVKYSTLPRVETLLTLLGVLGQETSKLGGVGALFPDSPYGNRGGGRGQGGRGGQRGQGDGPNNPQN